jgi:hypothetical protein
MKQGVEGRKLKVEGPGARVLELSTFNLQLFNALLHVGRGIAFP